MEFFLSKSLDPYWLALSLGNQVELDEYVRIFTSEARSECLPLALEEGHTDLASISFVYSIRESTIPSS